MTPKQLRAPERPPVPVIDTPDPGPDRRDPWAPRSAVDALALGAVAVLVCPPASAELQALRDRLRVRAFEMTGEERDRLCDAYRALHPDAA